MHEASPMTTGFGTVQCHCDPGFQSLFTGFQEALRQGLYKTRKTREITRRSTFERSGCAQN